MDIKSLSIDYLEISARSHNALLNAGIVNLGELMTYTEESLLALPKMGKKSVDEILSAVETCMSQTHLDIYLFIQLPEYRDAVLGFVKANNINIIDFNLSKRSQNALIGAGYTQLSDIVFFSKYNLASIKNMGLGSVEEVDTKIHEFLISNELRIRSLCDGNKNALVDDEIVSKMILELYRNIRFEGLRLDDITRSLPYAEDIGQSRIKKCIGHLLASGELEYVDYRCYRKYGKFEDYLLICPNLDERNRRFVIRKLHGETLESIASEYGLTRQRAQQIVKNIVRKVHAFYVVKTGLSLFDEDYYKYLYENYEFDKNDASIWLGLITPIRNYLQLVDAKQGKKQLEEALEDREIEAGMRQKIRNYLNRNSIFVNNTWVKKKRKFLEHIALEKFCIEKTTFDEFVELYNNFLSNEGIPYDSSIYITDDVKRTRKNHLGESRFLLHNLNDQFRFYDVDNRDYEDLIIELGLKYYKNTEISTLKFVEEHPELMERYDIRDQYELHSLLRKIIPEGSFNDFSVGRMPTLIFGTFDRNATILNLIQDNSPISKDDLCDLIHQEFGYDKKTILGSMLTPFGEYYHDGVFCTDELPISEDHKELLRNILKEDFYTVSEVKKLYMNVVNDGNEDEISALVLKSIGFKVRSGYIYRGAGSIDDVIETKLLSEDIVDMSKYRKRFNGINLFYYKLTELKMRLDLIEFEPDVYINICKLEKSGIGKTDLQNFCNQVSEFVEEGEFFIPSLLLKNGFESNLFSLGLGDLFLSSILASDNRFNMGKVYGAPIVCKGKNDVTIKSFLFEQICKKGVFDAFDLMNYLKQNFKCNCPDKNHIVYASIEGGAFYDKILDRLYASEEAYFEELDNTGTA